MELGALIGILYGEDGKVDLIRGLLALAEVELLRSATDTYVAVDPKDAECINKTLAALGQWAGTV
jgi:hypothetical protein